MQKASVLAALEKYSYRIVKSKVKEMHRPTTCINCSPSLYSCLVLLGWVLIKRSNLQFANSARVRFIFI